MNVVCFKVYDTNCQAAPLPSCSSLELIFLPSFSLPPSNYFILQKTAITKSLFLKK